MVRMSGAERRLKPGSPVEPTFTPFLWFQTLGMICTPALSELGIRTGPPLLD